MSRRFVETEGRRWIDMGIITPEQHIQIVKLYEEKKRTVGLVPLLGGLLVGLGILSFMAANWQGIPELLRLLLLIVVMTGCYGAGEALYKNGHVKMGLGIIGLGLLCFGAGIVLTAQMFHLEAYDAASWTVWGSAGLILAFSYRSRFLLAISAALFMTAQWYSAMEFHEYSYAAGGISLIGLGCYAWKRRDKYAVWLFSFSFIVQSIMLIDANNWKFLWVAVPVMLLYTLGDAAMNRKVFHPLQTAVIAVAFWFDWIVALFMDNRFLRMMNKEWLPEAVSFLSIMAVLLLASFFLKIRARRAITAIEWLLVPALLYMTNAAAALYLIILFVFSLYLLWRGYMEEWRLKINLATLLFLISTMTAYGKLTWDFMDKSMFFIVGGVLLLAISWVLNRRNKQFLRNLKEGPEHVQ